MRWPLFQPCCAVNDFLTEIQKACGMHDAASPLLPDTYLYNVFACKAVQQAVVIRRKSRDIERYVGRAALNAELDRRGFLAIENGGKIIIVCNREPLQVIT